MKANLPDWLTDRCRQAEGNQPVRLGPVMLVHHPEDVMHVLEAQQVFDKGARCGMR